MKKKMYLKIVMVTLLVCQILILPVNGSNLLEMEESNLKEMVENNTETLTQPSERGFIGYYYYGSQFEEPAFISLGADGNLKMDSSHEYVEWESKGRTIQSARWVGQLHIEKEDNYTFSTMDNDQVMMKIADELAIEKGEIRAIRLEAGLYEVEIEYQSDVFKDVIFDLQLSWKGTNWEEEVISSDAMLPVEFDEEKREVEFVPEEGLLKKKSVTRSDDHGYLDTDGDGIFDLWEINGYTVVNGIVMAWTEQLGAQGYPKYVSNPNRAHTAHDPYSDFEKASGQIDEGMSWEARNPLVAAVPAISVGMERVILSRLINESGEHGASQSRETSSSSSSSNTEGLDVTAGYNFSPLQGGFSMSATGHYSHTGSQTVEESNSTGNSWSNSISLNRGETAELNANIRYYNTGTGVVYSLEPTFNLVLERNTLATVRAQLNQQASHLAPSDTYPARRLNGIALNTLDQFSSRLIPLNYEQVQSLDRGEKLKLEMTQFTGQFVKRDASGGNIRAGDWDLYIPQIHRTSAAITLDIGDNEAIERRVAAKNPMDANDRTPELTLGEAVKIAFNAQEGAGGRLYYEDQRTGKKIAIDENAVHLVMDESTQANIKQQMKERNLDNVYDVIIRPEMAIHILPSLFLADADNHRPQLIAGSINGLDYSPDSRDLLSFNLDSVGLKPNTAYVLGFKSRFSAGINITIGSDAGTIVNENFEFGHLLGNRHAMIFTTGATIGKNLHLSFQGLDFLTHYDDISIVELKRNHKQRGQIIASWEGTAMTHFGDHQQLELHQNNKTEQQNFIFKYNEGKQAYQIWDSEEKYVLAWNTTNGTHVFMHPNEGRDEHYWVLHKKSNGRYIIYNYSNKNFALSSTTSGPNRGSLIRVFDMSGTNPEDRYRDFIITNVQT